MNRYTFAVSGTRCKVSVVASSASEAQARVLSGGTYQGALRLVSSKPVEASRNVR